MTFEKLDRTDRPLYGPRKLLLCGFSAEAHAPFARLIVLAGIGELPLVWVAATQADQPVSALLALPDGAGTGIASSLPRAIIASGITEKELHWLMAGAREARIPALLWATVTPSAEHWTIGRLLKELSAERDALNASGRGTSK